MDSKADWSDVPPGQVGPDFGELVIAQENENSNVPLISSGLSDCVGEIDIGVGEDELLSTPPPSVPPLEPPVTVVVSVSSGLLPTNLPSGMIPLDDRVHVPTVPKSDLTSNDLSNASGMGLDSLVKTESTLTTSLASTTSVSSTSSSNAVVVTPSTTPQVVWTHSKPTVMANLQTGKPSLTPPVLIGDIYDYAAAVPFVEKWKYIPNPDGVVRLPFNGLEQHIRQRLSPDDRKRLQMSAHRNKLNLYF